MIHKCPGNAGTLGRHGGDKNTSGRHALAIGKAGLEDVWRSLWGLGISAMECF